MAYCRRVGCVRPERGRLRRLDVMVWRVCARQTPSPLRLVRDYLRFNLEPISLPGAGSRTS